MKIINKKFIKVFLLWIIGNIILSFLIESICRGSLIDGFNFFLFTTPKALFNTFIVMLTTSFIFLFKKRFLAFFIIFSSWITLSIANNQLIKFRGSPLTGTDLFMLENLINIGGQYISITHIIFFILLILIIVGSSFIIWNFEKKNKRFSLKLVIPSLIISFLLSQNIISFAQKEGIVLGQLSDLFFSYEFNGFPYSFLYSLLNSGIPKPANYSKQTITYLSDLLDTSPTFALNNDNTIPDMDPNIIIIQLESFFDPMWMKDYSYNTDPIPIFRYLSENYTSGLLTVPVIGGGTVNTEFEVLTGLPISNFTIGEIPYNTIAKKKKIDSLNYILQEYGYSTHAIHNHDGTFYDRYLIYPNLGFNTFISSEYMYGYDKTPLGWMKDDILTSEIEKVLTSTTNQDFIYTVSTQGHGGYPSDIELENQKIYITNDLDDEYKKSWEYYLYQINQMDSFIGELVDMLIQNDEPTILVLFGDHLPGLQIKDDDLTTNDVYVTPFVIWDNFNLPKQDTNLFSYQLGSEILEKINITDNTIVKFHLTQKQEEDYLENLKLLQYDQLYGNNYLNNPLNTLPTSKLQMGISEIKITGFSTEGHKKIVNGENFTNHSRVFINGELCDTYIIDNTQLEFVPSELNEGDIIDVRQLGRNNIELSKTDSIIFNGF